MTSCNSLLCEEVYFSRFVVVLVTISYPGESLLLCMNRLRTVSDFYLFLMLNSASVRSSTLRRQGNS